ncbi:hypothetical protein LR48_Vigan805s000200 [Vigna angularis]|uniref:DUF632 domain-containing protein n=1 Tax=Phaseolus angularis TaxID=3914 RepID=A0A0L9TH78_PHAAN|nr:hypothetical protein LR48_Vigan805s000200 [Vigna angularis]
MEGRMKALEGRVDGRINAPERRMDFVKRWASKQKSGLAILDTPAEGRELFEVWKDLEDHFLRAYDFGKKVTRMLEANRIQEEWESLEEELPPPKPPDLNWRVVASGSPSYDNTRMKRSHEIKLPGSNLEDKVVLQQGVMIGYKVIDNVRGWKVYERRRKYMREEEGHRTVEGGERSSRTIEGGEGSSRTVERGEELESID